MPEPLTLLGVDIGATLTRAGVVDGDGALLASRTIHTVNDMDLFVPSLRDAIHWLLEATGMPSGVGVGCKGIVNPDSTTVEALLGPLHFLEGARLAEVVGLPLEIPVFADNDARVALAGEMVWGAAHGHENVLMLRLGNTVGGAAIVDGHLLRGYRGAAGNLGHLTVETDGLVCACGNRGCLETVFSARAIEGEAWAAVHRGCSSTLTRLFREQPQLASCRTVFQAASEGDALSLQIVGRAIRGLGAAIAGMAHVFDPEMIIIGGPVADAGADLLLPLREDVWARTRALLGREVPLVEQQVSDRSGIVSAAALVLASRG